MATGNFERTKAHTDIGRTSDAVEWAHGLWHKSVADFAASKGMSSSDVLTDLGRNLTLRVMFAEAVEAHVRGVHADSTAASTNVTKE
jgi:hypothetical protein